MGISRCAAPLATVPVGTIEAFADMVTTLWFVTLNKRNVVASAVL
jgi:hypothetical protein